MHLVTKKCALCCMITGANPGFRKGGAQLCYCEHGNCVRSTQSGMQSMPNLRGLGACPPGNFEKLSPLRLNLRAFLIVYCLYYN